ncbi:tRNA (adenosine(37)-N6)-threonylcarbamoyltransferase complex ATPase subunit type 1 TsaE [Limibacter armeniacum]|uniref:tRNA (adenosine(37)-N6)-threonylcarbamoyltransferase complex ATPase subunit type 1 TsaE n=1 Tax=Limibacter armeniacum TaxID=466084 RepID=UPI002FE68F9E
MEHIELESRQLSDLGEVANKIIEFAGHDNIWLFEGTLGAGKTTLIKAICDQYGVEDLVNSPTFSIVNEYSTSNGNTIYHFDFYRLDDEEEALDIGYEEYVDSGKLCLMEWPSRIPNLIPEDHILIEINHGTDDQRQIKVSKVRL